MASSTRGRLNAAILFVAIGLDDCIDGSCVLAFTTPSLEETKRWVMTYGANAEVLAPPKFRDMMRQELELIACRYAATAGATTRWR